jgi:acetyltransferase-like isoleucine patch superfamily enzyme
MRYFPNKFLSKNKKSSKPLNLLNEYDFKNVYIHPSTEIYGRNNLEIGEHCWIGPKCLIEAGVAKIKLHKYIAVAYGSILITNNHKYDEGDFIPFGLVYSSLPIEVDDFVWIGARSIILGGIKIEEGAIVGAGSIVTKSIPPLAIVAGNPAKIVGWRNKENYQKLKKDCKFFGLQYLNTKRTEEIGFFKPYLVEKN